MKYEVRSAQTSVTITRAANPNLSYASSSNKSKIIERQPPKQGRIYSTFKYAIKIPSGITPSQFDAWQTSEWTKASLLDSRGLPTRDVTIQRVGKIGKGQNSKLHITVSPLKSHDSSKWPVRFWGYSLSSPW